MTRLSIQDELQANRFWLLDISILDPLSAPVLNPLSGFSSITAPEITAEIIEITEGNYFFKKKMIGRGGVSSITLQRGARIWDHDFYNWIMHAITGSSLGAQGGGGLVARAAAGFNENVSPRKNLLLVQYFPRNPIAEAAETLQSSFALDQDNFNRGDDFRADKALNIFNFGPQSLVALIPARAWILYDCVPSKYKVSQDFNAKSAEISLMELTLETEGFEELAL